MYSNNKNIKSLLPRNVSDKLNVSSSEFGDKKNSMSSKQPEWLPLHHYRNLREQEFPSRPIQQSSLVANTPIYAENELQFHPSSLQNKIGSFSENLYAESMREKAKLGLLDPIKGELNEGYETRTSLYSPSHQNWNNAPTNSSVGNLVARNSRQTNIAKLQRDQISEDCLYISNSSNFNTKVEHPSIQPISDLKLESIDDEDEYLYGDSNSLPELSVKEKPKSAQEIFVKNNSVWSDEEELLEVSQKQSSEHDKFKSIYSSSKSINQSLDRKLSPNSWKSSDWRSQRRDGYKQISNSDKDLLQISKEKNSALQNKDKISQSKPEAFTSILKNKHASVTKFPDKSKSKDSSFESKNAVSGKKKPLQIALKESPLEKKSKYSAAVELRKKNAVMLSEKPNDSVKKKLLDEKKSQKCPERDIRHKKQLSEKEISILTSSKLEQIYVNINPNKRTVSVKESANSFSSDFDGYEMDEETIQEDTPHENFNTERKDKLPFNVSEKYSVGSQRTVRNVSDNSTMKHLVHHSSLNPAKVSQLSKTVAGKECFKLTKNVDLAKLKQQDVAILEKKVLTNIKEKSIGKISANEIRPIAKHIVQKNPKYYQLDEKIPARYTTELSPKYYGSGERSPRQHSRERISRHHSRERHHRPCSHERSPSRYSHEKSPRHYSHERSPKHYSRDISPRRHSRERSPRRHSRERSPRRHSRERSPRYHSYERSPKRYERDSRHADEHYKSHGRPRGSHAKHSAWEHDMYEHRSYKEHLHEKCQVNEKLKKSYLHETDLSEEFSEQSSEESSHGSPERSSSRRNRNLPKSKPKFSKLPLSENMDISPNEKEDDLSKKLALLRKAKMVIDIGTNKSDLEKSQSSNEEIVVKKDVENDDILVSQGNVVNEDATVNEAASAKVQGIQKISFVINRKQLPSDVPHTGENPHILLTKNEVPVLGIPSIISPPAVQPPVHPFQQYGYSPIVPSGYPGGNFTYPAMPAASPLMPYNFPPPVPPYYSSEIDPSPKVIKRPVHRVCSLKNIPTVSNIDPSISYDSVEMQVVNQDKIPHNESKEFIATDLKDSVSANFTAGAVHQTVKKSSLIQISCKQSPTKQNPVVKDTKAEVNIHIDDYRKLLEERNQLYKKLKMHNKTVSDLDAAKTNVEKKCAKVRSLFEKQTCSQFDSLIEKTKEQLTRYIEMSRNNASELQKIKIKIPPQLLSQIQESIKIAEPEPESSVNYNFFDSGNHWCEHCNNVFPTIPLLLQHFHNPDHPPCFDFKKKPWEFKEKESLTPDELKEAKLESVKGVEFLVPISGFHCSLCNESLPDAISAEKHVKSHNHFLKFKNHLKENPVYEKIKNLVRNFEQTRLQRDKKKRELEEKQLSAMKRQKMMAEKDKEIKTQIEAERQNEKTVTELCDDTANDKLSNNDNTTSNIKLHLADEKSPNISKQVKNVTKPNFIGRAPNFKPRLKGKSQKEGSPFDVKNAEESKVVGKQIQVIVAGEIIKPKGPIQLEKEKTPKETNSSKAVAKADNSPVIKNKENACTTSKSTVPLPEINLPPTSLSDKSAKSINIHVHPVKHSAEEEKDFLMLGINRNDFEPLAVPRPPPANLIQSRTNLENQMGSSICSNLPSVSAASSSMDTNTAQNIATVQAANIQEISAPEAPSQDFSSKPALTCSPVNIIPSSPHIQFSSPPATTFNTSYSPDKLSTLPIPPFPPPLQVPPPNVVLQCAQNNVCLSRTGQHNLPQYAVVAPQKFSTISFPPTISANQNAMSNPKNSFDQHSATPTEHHARRNLTVVNVTTENSVNAGKTGNKTTILSNCSKSGLDVEVKNTCVQLTSKREAEDCRDKIVESKTNVDTSKVSDDFVSKSAELQKNNLVDSKQVVVSEINQLPTVTDEQLRTEMQEASDKIMESDKIISTDVDFGAFFMMSSIKRKKQKSSEGEKTETNKELCIKNTSCADNNIVSISEFEGQKNELMSVSTNSDTNSSDFQLGHHEFSDKSNILVDPPKTSASETSLDCSNIPKIDDNKNCPSQNTDGTEIVISANEENLNSNQNSVSVNNAFYNVIEVKENVKDSQKDSEFVRPESVSCREDNNASAPEADNKLTSMNIISDANTVTTPNQTVEPDIGSISLQPVELNSSEKPLEDGKFSEDVRGYNSSKNKSDVSESKILPRDENVTNVSDESCSLNVIEENNKDISMSDLSSLSSDNSLAKSTINNIEYEEHNSDLGIQHSGNLSQCGLVTESGSEPEPSSNIFSNETNISSKLFDKITDSASSICSIESKVKPLSQDVMTIKNDCKINSQQIVNDELQVQTPYTLAASPHTNEQSFFPNDRSEENAVKDLNHAENQVECSSSNLNAATEISKNKVLLEKQGEIIQNFGLTSEDSSSSANFSDPINCVFDSKNLESRIAEEPISSKVSEVVMDEACVLPSACSNSCLNVYSRQENSEPTITCTALDLQKVYENKHQTNDVSILMEQDNCVNEEESRNSETKFDSEINQEQDVQCSHDTISSVDNSGQSTAHSSHSNSVLSIQNSDAETVVNATDFIPNTNSTMSLSETESNSVSTHLNNMDKESITIPGKCLVNENNPSLDSTALKVTENTSSITSVSQGHVSSDLASSLLQEFEHKLTQQHISDDLSKGENVGYQTSISEIVSQVNEAKGSETEKMTDTNVFESIQVCEAEGKELCEQNTTCLEVNADLKTEASVSAEPTVSTDRKEETVSCELALAEENKDDSEN